LAADRLDPLRFAIARAVRAGFYAFFGTARPPCTVISAAALPRSFPRSPGCRPRHRPSILPAWTRRPWFRGRRTLR